MVSNGKVGTDGDTNTELSFTPNHWGSTVAPQTLWFVHSTLRFIIEMLREGWQGSKEQKWSYWHLKAGFYLCCWQLAAVEGHRAFRHQVNIVSCFKALSGITVACRLCLMYCMCSCFCTISKGHQLPSTGAQCFFNIFTGESCKDNRNKSLYVPIKFFGKLILIILNYIFAFPRFCLNNYFPSN